MAELCHYTHEKLIEEVGKVFQEVKDKKIPGWVAHYLQGYRDCLRDMIWKKMEYAYLYKGRLYSTDRDSKHRKTEWFYKREKGHMLGNLPSAHVWKGTDKPFTKFEVSNEKYQKSNPV